MSGLFSFLSPAPKPAKPSMSQPIGRETPSSPTALTRQALAFGAPPASTDPDSSTAAKLPVSSRKQKAKTPATAALEAPDVPRPTPRKPLSAKQVYSVRKSLERSADRIPRSQQKKMFRAVNKPNSLASPAASALAISNIINPDVPSGDEDDDDIPASAPSVASANTSIKRPAVTKGVAPLFTQAVGATDTSAMFEDGDDEEEARPTQRPSKALRKAQVEESRRNQHMDETVEAINAEDSSAALDPYDMDIDDSVNGDEPIEPTAQANTQTATGTQDDEDSDDNFCTIDSLLKHRVAANGQRRGGNFEILVKWQTGEETWEPEVILHEDAPRALFEYWESQDGRPDDGKGIYRAVRFKDHRKKNKRYQVLVEWLGYPPEEDTWEMLAAMKKAAPEIYADYRERNPDAPK